MVGGTMMEEQCILLLDGDTEFRALLGAVLNARGYRVLEAASAQAATTVLLTESPDLVIVDGLLPDLPGVEWIESIRQGDAETLIVYLSAFWRDLATFQRLTQELGVSLVAYKPLDPLVFAETIGRLLKLEPRRTDSVPPTVGSAPAEPPDTLRARMAQLREAYTLELPGKLDELEARIDEARQRPDAAKQAASSAHRLRGTAGAYGFKLVGVLAGKIEDLLSEYQSSPLRVRRNLWTEISRALEDARLAARSQGSTSRVGLQSMDTVSAGTILFVDDDADVRRTAKLFLRKQLLDVCVAGSAPEALHKAASIKLAAAIVDVHLKERSGFDLCRELRELPGKENLPLVLMSGDQRLETRVAATQVGASLFIEKPLREDVLSLAVQQIVDETSARHGRVLLLEDDPDFAKHAELLLQANDIDTRAIVTPAELPSALEEFRPDLLLLDIDLPNTSGVDVCKALRMSVQWQTLPILMITAHVDDDMRIEAFRSGANDFISKPVLEEEFNARVDMQLMHARLLQERAERDPLSGLMLRRPFLEALEQRLSEAHRNETPLALALIDIDHFKQVNDGFGHTYGDTVIAGLGRLLRQRFRHEDLRCRWGGEEFIVVLPGQKAELLERALGRVLKELSEMRFEASDRTTFSVTASAGVAARPDDGLSAEALIRRADRRLYQAKSNGRNRIVGPSSHYPDESRSGFRKQHIA
ncbi:MAG: response regulator [Deltaproteobacteria bacterium]|nr:response regulator [Myxococcales bacterium]RZV53500.1 MAG: response regulator [Deltaproteobacteria bacterium]